LIRNSSRQPRLRSNHDYGSKRKEYGSKCKLDHEHDRPAEEQQSRNTEKHP
jgi:hypothetical protein